MSFIEINKKKHRKLPKINEKHLSTDVTSYSKYTAESF